MCIRDSDRPFPEVLDDFYSDTEGDILFFGHTHIPLSVVGNTGRFYVNPGSVGVENVGRANYIIMDDESDSPFSIARRSIVYDQEKVISGLKKKKVPYSDFIIGHFFAQKGSASSTVNDI
jgi:diadenosine tetraphosphatase ApaH/serine/threonine PP2A family protein phosphatase